jgi:hypothetical protein
MHQELHDEEKPIEVDQYTTKQLVQVLIGFLNNIHIYNMVANETEMDIVDLTELFTPIVRKYSRHVDFNKMSYDDLQLLTYKVFEHSSNMLQVVEDTPDLPLIYDLDSNMLYPITALEC